MCSLEIICKPNIDKDGHKFWIDITNGKINHPVFVNSIEYSFENIMKNFLNVNPEMGCHFKKYKDGVFDIYTWIGPQSKVLEDEDLRDLLEIYYPELII